MIRFFTPLFLSFLLLLCVTAQVPNGYYAPAEGKTNAQLKTALHLIIKNANVPAYGSGDGKTLSSRIGLSMFGNVQEATENSLLNSMNSTAVGNEFLFSQFL